jgi:hypothetical protein
MISIPKMTIKAIFIPSKARSSFLRNPTVLISSPKRE